MSTINSIGYVFQTGEGEYWRVGIALGTHGGSREVVNMIGVLRFVPTEENPISQYKVYPWPGLYPVPGK